NINATSLIALLDAIRGKHPGTAITLIMDNARYQRCRVVMEHARSLGIELLFLPPYSPNLNLIERLWKLTKRRCLTNRYHRDFGGFCEAIDRCLDDLGGRLKPEMESLLTPNFQFFAFHKSRCAAVHRGPILRSPHRDTLHSERRAACPHGWQGD